MVYRESMYGREAVAGIRAYCQEIKRDDPWFLLTRRTFDDLPLQQIANDHPDGVIAQIFSNEIAEQINATGIPWVNIGDSLDLPHPPLSTSNNPMVGQIAAEHLLNLGVCHFGFVCNSQRYSKQRHAGFVQRLEEEGYECSRFDFSKIISWNESPELLEQITENAAEWLEALPKPVGVFCSNDDYAQAINDVCARHGLSVPQQVLILGVDNDDLMCEATHPTLSSIQLNAEQIGYQAAAVLDRMMAGDKGVPRVTTVDPVGLVPRMSTELIAVEDEIVRRALIFIQENACGAINVDHVAADAGISRRLLELRFSKALRHSPAHEIRRRRIERAMELLRDTDWPIARIAEAAGFNSPGRFATAFRNWNGTPPLAYRKQNRRR